MPTPRFGLPYIAQGQAQKEVTHNEALSQLDALIDLYFLDRDLTAPPGSPTDGDTYLVAGSPTGAWAGHAGEIAYCLDGAWRFYAPAKGLFAYVADQGAILVYTGATWVNWATLLSFQNVALVGINTSADVTNKLAAKTNAILFAGLEAANGGNGDIQVKLRPFQNPSRRTSVRRHTIGGLSMSATTWSRGDSKSRSPAISARTPAGPVASPWRSGRAALKESSTARCPRSRIFMQY